MSGKQVFTLLGVLIIGAWALFLYHQYGQEPEATYLRTENPRLIQLRKDLEQLKSHLRREGLYACCIRNDCNWCALYLGSCICARLVSKKGGEKSCLECAAAWNKKQGKIFGVDPQAIGVTTFDIYGVEKEEENLF